MSYSRWSHSRWYTYWLASSVPENRNNATFVVDGIDDRLEFSAAELRKDMDGCVRRAVAEQGGSDDEANELKGYMQTFLRAVDKRYPRRARSSTRSKA